MKFNSFSDWSLVALYNLDHVLEFRPIYLTLVFEHI